jgi:hypothetical protein
MHLCQFVHDICNQTIWLHTRLVLDDPPGATLSVNERAYIPKRNIEELGGCEQVGVVRRGRDMKRSDLGEDPG